MVTGQQHLAVYRRWVAALLALSVWLLATLATVDQHSVTLAVIDLGLLLAAWLPLLVQTWRAWDRLVATRRRITRTVIHPTSPHTHSHPRSD